MKISLFPTVSSDVCLPRFFAMALALMRGRETRRNSISSHPTIVLTVILTLTILGFDARLRRCQVQSMA